MRKIYFLLVMSFLFVSASKAQVANYSFSASSGTYTPISSPTNIFTGTWDDNAAVSVNLGFTFRFNDVDYTSVLVHPNGYLTLGTSTTGYTPISGTSTAAGVIAAWARDLQSQATPPTGSVDYESSGGVFTVQWSNARRYNSTTVNTERTEMQIKLYQGTNLIEFVYGNWSDAVSAFTTNNGEVGLRGSSNADFKNLSVLSGGNWATPSAGAVNTATVFYNQSSVATKPAPGQTYTFTPPADCVSPPSQPTNLNLLSGAGGVGGTFTAAAGSPTGYLVVRTASSAPPSAPVNGTIYAVGSSALGGTIVSNDASTSFASLGLAQNTTYYFWVYSYSSSSCWNGPAYLTTSPLSGNATTTSCTVTGTKTVGPSGNYLTLNAAILDLVTNGLAGPVVLELLPAYASAGEIFPITIPTIPCISAVNNLTIRPQAGVVSMLNIVTSNTTTVIDMHGASYVTIDGRPGGTGSNKFLTISNTSTATGGSAIRFINEASSNTIEYVVLKSLYPSTTSGVVHFSTTIGSEGNDDNTIDNCNIDGGAAGTASPTLTATNGIYSAGTTTTAARANSGNTISNNNIFDFFNAGTASNGISISVGNTDWTISGNSLYQTASRTTTASNQYTGILIHNTSGNNFQVTGNFIGGSAPNAGGTPWTITNTNFTNRFVGIQLTAGTSLASTADGNTITNFSIGTNSSASTLNGNFSGIWSSGGNINIGGVTGNTIGSNTGNGAIALTLATNSAGTANIIAYSGTGIVNITNNRIGSINLTGATATIGYGFNGILVSGGTPTITGNTIGSTVTANSITSLTVATGTQAVMGIQVTSGVTTPTTISNNTVANLNQSGTSTASLIRGIQYGGTGFGTLSGNAVNNISGSSANTTVAGGATAVQGICYTGTSPAGALITLNTIHTISANNTGTVATVVTGIGYSNPSSGVVTRNRIYNLRNASTGTSVTAPPMAIGLLIRAALTEGTFSNNMISLGNAQSTNTQFVGIMNSFFTNTVKVYFNTVNIEGTVTAGALPSFAFLRGDNSATALLTPVDVRNNILNNTRSGGTGKHYAIGNNYGATASATGWGVNASNYNLLNASAATVGYWTSDRNFSAWQVASGSDVSSLSGYPATFVNSATGDLHLNMGATPTPIESGGTVGTGVVVDYDLDARPGPAGSLNGGATAPDLGADEFDGTPLDVTGPIIVHTPLPYTCNSSARTLVATITDVSGVPTAGAGLPVLYWRINAGAYTPVTAVYLGSNQYEFTFGAGAVVGDVVSYYIVAQDNSAIPNVSAFPTGGSGFTINPPAAATAPGVPSSYTIVTTSLTGTYNVGVGQTYTTLTAAVAAYNTACLTGPVVFQLMDATYTGETFPITINANPYASSTNTLTIRPGAGVNSVISGSNSSSIIKLNAADFVIIDGSNNGTTSRNLTLTNTNTGTSSVVVWLASTSTGNGATNNTIKNNVISGNASATTLAGILTSGSSAGSVAEGQNSFNTIQNNAVSTSFYGIVLVGPGGNEPGNVVSGNMIGSATTANKIGFDGIALYQQQDILVSENTIFGINSTTTGTGSSASGIAVAGTASGGFITGNKISDIKKAGLWGSNGIQLGSSTSNTSLTISNNMIFDVASAGFASGVGIDDNGYGIAINTGGGYNIYHNTVNLNTNQATAGSTTAALWISSSITTPGSLDIRNNIFTNTQTTNNRYAIYSNSSNNNIFAHIDYNAYFTSGASLGFIGSARADLSALQTGFGGNLNSINFEPSFVSASDLHLVSTPGTNWCLNGTGISLASVSVDFDNEPRSTGVKPNGPDLGADEFAASGFVINNPAAICDGGSVDLTTASITAGSMAGLTFEYFTDAATTISLANPNAVTVGGIYYIKAINGTCSLVLPVVITINPKPTISGSVVQPTTCVSTDGSITLTLGGAVGPYTFAWVGSGVNPTAQDQSNLVAGSYSVTVTAANGCTEVAVFSLSGPGGCNVCPQVPSVTTTPSATSCVGTDNTITATGLVDMGVTYGVTFKYSTSALADPYSGGTVIATVANGSLTSGATVATTTHNFAATGNYIIYAILSPVPADPGCRPFAQVNLTVNSAPTVTCPANITVSNDANQCGAIVNYAPASGTGVPAPTITYDIPSGSFFPVGTTTVTATATNGCGTATCTFTVTVNDTQTPTITCPANITASNTAGLCSATVNTANPTATDNCPGFVVTWALTGATTATSPAIGVNFVGSRSFNVGVTTVTYTIRDAANNSSTCSFTVTVNDTQAPTVTCPSNITVSNGAGACSASVNTPNPTSNDNCGVTIRTWALTGATTGASPATGLNNVATQNFNVGVTTVTYTVTDAAGNTGSCSFTVTVNDTQLPVITCPGNITVSTPVGSCTAVVNYTVTATDNCPGVTTALQAGLASGASFPVGVTTVTYRATDAAGNTSTCSFTVTVNDGQLPVISTQPVAQTSCVGSSATFSVTASNATGYQWQSFSAGVWSNIAGATSSTYTVNNLTTAMNTNTYRVIVNGLCSSVTSNMATLFVNTLPQISLHPSMAPNLEPGDVMSITATGIPPGGSYVWLLDGNVIAGASGNVLNNVTVNGLGTYTVRYTDPRGCVSNSAPLVVTGTASNSVWVYPNPNNGQFQVRVFATGSTSPLTIRVYDSKGSLVYEKEHQTVLPFTQMDVNLGVKSSGIYTVRVHDGSGNIIGAKSVLVRY